MPGSAGALAALRKVALKYPLTEEGVACEGTAIERRTVKVKGKAFVFLGPKDAMLKLGPSRAEAKRMGFAVGSGGWVKVAYDGAPVATLKQWIGESYGLMAPK
jgi:hypothetical protein